MNNFNKYSHIFKFTTVFAVPLTILTILSALLLSTPHASADSSSAIDVSLEVMAACSLSATSGSDLSTTINAGSDGNIGTTSLKAVCNDNGGLAIYAIGYTGNTHGDTNLRRQETIDTLSTTNFIPTGVSLSTSYWNMTVTNNTSVSGNYTATIPAAFQSAHAVPTNQTQIASYSSSTDQTTGLNINIAYNAHAAIDQAAGTYKGKVRYTLVHPALHEAPANRPATLDTGRTVNSKMKTLAASVVDGTTSTVDYEDSDSYIKTIEVHTGTSTLPSGLTPSSANTISVSSSASPAYIVFDNTNDAGVMHIYTTGDGIVLNKDCMQMFSNFIALSSIPGISDWDASDVVDAQIMFSYAGYNATTFSLDLSGWDTSSLKVIGSMFSYAGYNATTFSLDLSGWNTSQVMTLSNTFRYAGYSATTWSINGLSGWDTSQVSQTYYTFDHAGYNATAFSLDLSGWDTSQVGSMSNMFQYAGYSATTWSVGDLSGWNTSNVAYMESMFRYAGYNASTFSLDLSGWNTSNVTRSNSMFQYAGRNATTFSLDLSGWNTSKNNYMSSMFDGAGSAAAAANWSVIIPQTNSNGTNNTTSRMYGITTSYYAAPPSGKSFTIAQ